MPLPAAMVLAFLPFQTHPVPYPMMEYKAGYLQGEPLACEITQDGTRAFIAEGAVVAVLDLNTPSTAPPGVYYQISPASPPPSAPPYGVIQRIDIPDASTNALLLYKHPGAGVNDPSWLFIAGGTLGLSRINICQGLLNTPPTACSTTDFTVMDTANIVPFDPTHYVTPLPGQYKRCVDLAIVERSPSLHLLFALYAASSMYSPTSQSELRAYVLNADGTFSFYGLYRFSTTSTRDSSATAITVDPADNSHVYVALGREWLWTVDISSVSSSGMFPAAHPVPVPSNIIPCQLPGNDHLSCAAGESMRDIAAVRRTSDGHFYLYAALDYGRLLEYDTIQYDSSGVPTLPLVTERFHSSCGYPNKIAAISDSADGVMVAFSTESEPSASALSHAPQSPTSLWSGPCLTPVLGDPNGVGAVDGACQDIYLFRRSTTLSFQPVLATPIASSGDANALILRRFTDLQYRVYSLATHLGLQVDALQEGSDQAIFASLPLERYVGYACPAGGSIVSTDGTLLYLGYDGFAGGSQGLQYEIDSTPSIKPVAETFSLCPNRSSALNLVDMCPLHLANGDPDPFVGNITGGARWRDSTTGFDWFIRGGLTWVKTNSNCDDPPADPILDECASDPCDHPSPPYPLSWKEGLIQGAPVHDVGFAFVRLSTLSHPLTGTGEAMNWWQLGMPTAGTMNRSTRDPYISSFADPRMITGSTTPRFIYGLRSGSYDGLKVFRTQDIQAFAATTCAGSAPGNGESLMRGPPPTPTVPNQYYSIPYVEAMTHIEFEDPSTGSPCICYATCAGSSADAKSLINLFTNRVDVFSLTDPADSSIHWVAAVAAGFIASGTDSSSPQPPGCNWIPYYGCSNLLFFEVPNPVPDIVPALPPPPYPPSPTTYQLLRVALSGKSTQLLELGHAYAVKAKRYTGGPQSGKTFVFVADSTGNLLIYKVTYDSTTTGNPVTDLIPVPPSGVPYFGSAPFLFPAKKVSFPVDPFDGQQPNCLAVELDGEYAYCALGRGGLGIVDIYDPLHPIVTAIVDTPGLAEALALRQDAVGHHQLVVSDSRAGLRLYGIPGE